MTLVNISLEDRCTVACSGFDPLAQGSVRVSGSINLDVLYHEIYFNDIGRRGTGVSKRTGRPTEDIIEDDAKKLYASAQVALGKVRRELDKSVIDGGFGLKRDDLVKLKHTLETIASAKEDYFAERKIKKDEPEIDFTRFGSFQLADIHGNTYIYMRDYNDDDQKHPLTVKVSPTSRDGIYLFESEARLKAASEPFYTSRRYVNLRHSGLKEELNNEHEVLRYLTKKALESQRS